MGSVTLQEVVIAVRELIFDRFIVPAFAVKEKMGYNISINPKQIVSGGEGLLTIVNAETTEQLIGLSFVEYPTLRDLMNKLIEEGIIVAYTAYFRDQIPTTELIKVDNRDLSENFTSFRLNFFTEEEIKRLIMTYYAKVLDIFMDGTEDLSDDLLGKLKRPSEQHMAIWVAYHLVELRRMYEEAAQALGNVFTDGTGYENSSTGNGNQTTNVSIGSVFSITEDPSRGFFSEDFSRLGSDNIWGDRYSFWYKLQCYLRQLLEERFRDYSLRKDNVMMGNVELVRELDFRSYYDSYPFTLSPLSRGIVSKTP